MKDNNHYFETNQKLWDSKTPIHIDSNFYNMPQFLTGVTSLRKVELELLENLKDKSVLHSQCHFGQDTLSLERMGASCTGVDFSTVAIEKAKEIRDVLELKSEFVSCNVYDIDKHITTLFDIVYSSYGVISWLPDLDKWASQLSKRLKTGGRFYLVEFHPMLYMFDWDNNILKYDYFNSGHPEIEIEKGTYADPKANIELKEYFWMHSLSEVIQALIENGLKIDDFREYDYSPYEIFGSCKARGDQEYVYQPMPVKIPHLFSIIATKA